ncbi:RNase H family protein [Providencia vermicola]
MTKQVEIFTDGSCLGNPGPGGMVFFFVTNNMKKRSVKAFFNDE